MASGAKNGPSHSQENASYFMLGDPWCWSASATELRVAIQKENPMTHNKKVAIAANVWPKLQGGN
jgi:hypothetical protein